jgi:hypothetical protein
MRYALISLVALSIFLSMSGSAISASTATAGTPPALFFSDLNVASNTGLTDGSVKNQGAIVTIWGTNLGSSQGTSTITVGGVAPAYIYYWKNADGTLPGGPADLYTKQQMQEIAFALSSSTPTGSQNIVVTVSGSASNALPITVTNTAGTIYFVSSSGTDGSGCGTWASPCATYGYLTCQNFGNNISPGAVIYNKGNITISNSSTNACGSEADDIPIATSGTSTAPDAIVVYPDTTLTLTSSVLSSGVQTVVDGLYWTVSKATIAVDFQAIALQNGARIIGNSITGLTYQQSNAGILGGFSSGWVVYGNYIYNLTPCNGSCNGSCSGLMNQQHVIYITHRDWNTNPNPMNPVDIGWNRISNNSVRFAIHFYDENNCGEITTGSKVHDNWVENQDGPCVDFAGGGCFAAGNNGTGGTASLGYFSVGTVNVYNNVCVSGGLDRAGCSPNHTDAFEMDATQNSGVPTLQNSTINWYNNTIYSYAYSSSYNCANDAGDTSTSWCTAYLENGNANTNLTWASSTWVNNLVFDVGGFNYAYFYNGANPSSHSNNLYYSSATPSMAVAAWDTSPVNSNPLFSAAGSDNFTLGTGSPALAAGLHSVAPTYDIIGDTRPNPPSIGAFDDPPASTGAPPALTKPPWLVQ